MDDKPTASASDHRNSDSASGTGSGGVSGGDRDIELSDFGQSSTPAGPTNITGSFPRHPGTNDPLTVRIVSGRGPSSSSATHTTITTTSDIDDNPVPPPEYTQFYRHPGGGGGLGSGTYYGPPVPSHSHDGAFSGSGLGEGTNQSITATAGHTLGIDMCDSGKSCTVICGTIVVLIIMSCVLIGISLRRLEVYEVGVKYHTIRKELEEGAQKEGLHLGEPGFEFVIFPSIFKTLTWDDFRCINKDGVDVIIDMGFQYKVIPTHLKDIILEFKDYDGYIVMIRNMADTVIHETCSYFDTDTLQTNRTVFQESMRSLMLKRLGEEISTTITDLQVKNLQRPPDYQQAIRDKESAKESIKVALNERPRKITKAETEKKEALTQATIQINKAEADARSISAKALADAAGILFSYEKEADAYKGVKDSLGLNVEGLLSYMSSEVIYSANKPVVNIDAPARSQYTSITD